MNSNSDYTICNLDNHHTYSAHPYNAAAANGDFGVGVGGGGYNNNKGIVDDWATPYDHQNPISGAQGPSVRIPDTLLDHPRLIDDQRRPSHHQHHHHHQQQQQQQLLGSGYYSDGCISRCPDRLSRGPQCGPINGAGMASAPQGLYGPPQLHRPGPGEGYGGGPGPVSYGELAIHGYGPFYGLGPESTHPDLGPPPSLLSASHQQSMGMCPPPPGAATPVSPILYPCYPSDQTNCSCSTSGGGIYSSYPSCHAGALCFPPPAAQQTISGNCLTSSVNLSDHANSVTTYKWMTVKRGLPKSGTRRSFRVSGHVCWI